MTVKTITLSEDAYVALAQVKKEGESFSDVVLRLARGRRSLLEFAGDWKDFPEEKMTAYLAFLGPGVGSPTPNSALNLNVGSDGTGQARNVVPHQSLEERLRDRPFVRTLSGRAGCPLVSPCADPKPHSDQRDSRSDERRPDGDELGLDSCDAVRHSDLLPRFLRSRAVRKDEVVCPGTREINRKGTGRAVCRKQGLAQADERIPFVLRLAKDVHVHDATRESGELPRHAAAPEHLDVVRKEPRGSGRNRRDRSLCPLQERSREERLSGEKQDAADEEEDPRRLPEIRNRSEAASPLHRPAPS